MKNFLNSLRTKTTIGRGWILFILILLTAFGEDSYGQAQSWPNCTTCIPTPSEDFVVSQVYLGDVSGNPLNPGFQCIPGATVNDVYIYAVLTPAGQGVNRYSLGVRYDLVTIANEVETRNVRTTCLYEHQQIPTNTPIQLQQIQWICGDELRLENVCLTYNTNSASGCKCYDDINGDADRCQFAELFVVKAPLIPKISVTTQCSEDYLYETVTFTSTTTGGEIPYIYSWTLK